MAKKKKKKDKFAYQEVGPGNMYLLGHKLPKVYQKHMPKGELAERIAHDKKHAHTLWFCYGMHGNTFGILHWDQWNMHTCYNGHRMIPALVVSHKGEYEWSPFTKYRAQPKTLDLIRRRMRHRQAQEFRGNKNRLMKELSAIAERRY